MVPNRTGRNFVGAGGDTIKKHGTCMTLMKDEKGRRVGSKWNCADVTRALHSVSTVTGPQDGSGEHDVLFNNKRCVVVEPGVVDKVLAMMQIEPITEYAREGNLYIGEFDVSDFVRPGQNP